MKNIEDLIDRFINLAKISGEELLNGNDKEGNKANKKMMKIFKEIKNLKGQDLLYKYLDNDNESIKLCVASFLIDIYPKKCVKTLEEIQMKKNLFSLFAEARIDIWKKGL